MKLRESEIRLLWRCAIYDSVMSFGFGFTTYVVTIVSFITFIYMDEKNQLNPSIAYVSLALFNKIRTPLYLLAPAISNILQVELNVY
jgi:hypothetical protein